MLVLFSTFPPTHQLRIMTVRENGIYEKLLLTLIDHRIVSKFMHSIVTSLSSQCGQTTMGIVFHA